MPVFRSDRAVQSCGQVDQAFRRFHPGQRADLVQHGVKNLGVRCRDLQQKVEAARGGEHALNLADAFQAGQDGGLGPWLDGQQHACAQAALTGGFAELQGVTGDDPAGFQPFEAGLNGGTGDFQAAGEGGHRHPGVSAQQGKDVSVKFVHHNVPFGRRFAKHRLQSGGLPTG